MSAPEKRPSAAGGGVSRPRLWLGYLVRGGPWFAAAVPVSLVAERWLLPAAGVAAIAVSIALAVLLVWRGLACSVGYRPVVIGDLRATAQLVHLSSSPASAFGGGEVHLDPGSCRRGARMLRADRWVPHRRVAAVYFFPASPTLVEQGANVSRAPRSRIVIDVAALSGPVFQRWDGCIALPTGYRGTARVDDLAPPLR